MKAQMPGGCKQCGSLVKAPFVANGVPPKNSYSFQPLADVNPRDNA